MSQKAEEEPGTDEGQAPKKKRGKLLLIAIPAGVILLLLGAGAGLYFTGMLDSMLGKKQTADASEPAKPKDPVFFDLPDMLVNLNVPGRKSNFLKMTVSLELETKEDEAKVQNAQPIIVDTFQSYLRELRPEDLRGSAGLYRLREELLARVKLAVAPAKVDDVLFRDMLVQ
jgi:flagellar FliL protein